MSVLGYRTHDICSAFGVPRSTYYRLKTKDRPSPMRRRRRNDEPYFIKRIKELKADHPFWGYRRVWAWINYRDKKRISRRRVYRLMKEYDLTVNVKQYKAKRISNRSKPKPKAANQWWGIDMTKFLVNGIGWIYLVVVLDWFTKKVVGYNLNSRCRAKEWIAALEMAVLNQCPQGSRTHDIHLMSDNGSQPTSISFIKASSILGIQPITTSYANPKGNADTERFMRTFKEEKIWPYEYDSFEQVANAVRDFFKFYNEEYPHSVLGYLSPVEFEQKQKEIRAA
jgi:putative transposase